MNRYEKWGENEICIRREEGEEGDLLFLLFEKSRIRKEVDEIHENRAPPPSLPAPLRPRLTRLQKVSLHGGRGERGSRKNEWSKEDVVSEKGRIIE